MTDTPIPSPVEVGVEDAPYLNGIAEAIEGRRHALDLLREGRVADGEAMLSAMDDLYAVLVTMDYPDAITSNLRRSTDVARSLIEKTRGTLRRARLAGPARRARPPRATGSRRRVVAATRRTGPRLPGRSAGTTILPPAVRVDAERVGHLDVDTWSSRSAVMCRKIVRCSSSARTSTGSTSIVSPANSRILPNQPATSPLPL